jgi:hypothetical protein
MIDRLKIRKRKILQFVRIILFFEIKKPDGELIDQVNCL